jgi:hypothetical protein
VKNKTLIKVFDSCNLSYWIFTLAEVKEIEEMMNNTKEQDKFKADFIEAVVGMLVYVYCIYPYILF